MIKKLDIKTNSILVVGNESNGISNSLVKAAANSGSVDTVVIENAGSGYNNKDYTNVPIRGDWEINGGTQAFCTVKVESSKITSVTITSA